MHKVGWALVLCTLISFVASADAFGDVTIVKGVVARDVVGNSPIAQKNFTYQDAKVWYWIETDGIYYGNQTLVTQYIAPDNSVYTAITHDLSDRINQELYWTATWIGIAGQAAANKPGTWTVKFFINGTLMLQDTFTITGALPPPPPPPHTSGLTVVGGRITAEFPNNACIASPTPKYNYTAQDTRAGFWVETDGIYQGESVVFEFYDPYGSRHVSIPVTNLTVGFEVYSICAWIFISGSPAANLPGQWTAKLLINGMLKSQDTFTISAGNACGYSLGSGIYNKWIALGGQSSFLGCPIMNEAEAGMSPQGTTGRWVEFSGGDGGFIIWHRMGPHAGASFEVHGCIFKLYKSLGGTGSWLGFPVSDEYDVPGGRRSDFEGGYILWNAQTFICQAHNYGTSPPPLLPPPPPPPAPGPGVCIWTGSWILDVFPGTFIQTGNQVTGSFGNGVLTLAGTVSGVQRPDRLEGIGVLTLVGTVSGNTLTGKWSDEVGGSGDFELTMSADCNSISGRYRLGSTGPWTNVTGTRSLGPTPPPGGGNPWDSPVGQNCFERWISEAMSKVNSYNGTTAFNNNKPYRINQYGLLEGKSFHSVAPPDNFRDYNFNKYWYMWDWWNTWSSITGWPDNNWDGAGVPPLRDFVAKCIADSGGTTPPPPPPPAPPGAGNPWDSPVGKNCFERWISEAMSKVNSYNGTQAFNNNKPYRINQYGLLEGKSFHSVAAPDNFRDYNFNKYWYMWDWWNTWSSITGWPDNNWDGAGVPPLRSFVNECIAQSGGGPLFLKSFDTNNNDRVDDPEFFDIIDVWIAGQLDDTAFFDAIDLWISQGSLASVGLSRKALSLDSVSLSLSLGGRAMTFTALGQGITGIGVDIFDLNGRRIHAQEIAGTRLRWDLRRPNGELIANGIYLYVVTVRGRDGTILRSEVSKLALLR
jgi:hypothetical protein